MRNASFWRVPYLVARWRAFRGHQPRSLRHGVRISRHVFEANRETFLRSWIAQPGARRLGVKRHGQLAGWGLLRACVDGYKIGPLVADDSVIAEKLLDGLRAAAPGQPVYIDIPQSNHAAMHLVESRGMTPCFETARMYKGEAPFIEIDKVFGITSFEVG